MNADITFAPGEDIPEWLLDGTKVVFVPEKDLKYIMARSLRNFQLYLDANAEAMRERWRLEDEIAALGGRK